MHCWTWWFYTLNGTSSATHLSGWLDHIGLGLTDRSRLGVDSCKGFPGGRSTTKELMNYAISMMHSTQGVL